MKRPPLLHSASASDYKISEWNGKERRNIERKGAFCIIELNFVLIVSLLLRKKKSL